MDALKELQEQIRQCAKCELRAGATHPVPGIGGVHPKFMLIGEAPGREEDLSGVPFVGAAGKKLNKLLKIAGISTNDCYLTNVCRCRPPDNRPPRKKEVKSCVPFLMQEIQLVQPQTIITLGSTPLQVFSPFGVKQMHGTMFKWVPPWK